MGEELGDGGIGRRDLLKKSAVAGGLVWAAPAVFSATAGAGVTPAASCTDCPEGQLFGIKYNNGTGLESLPTSSSGGGNCLTASAPFPTDCLSEEGLFDIEVTDGGDTHTWTLQPALELCQAAAKSATVCQFCPDGTTTFVVTDCDGAPIDVSITGGVTTVVITNSQLSHSEILFCYRGSPLNCED